MIDFYVDLGEVEDGTLLPTMVDLLVERGLGYASQMRPLVDMQVNKGKGYLEWSSKDHLIGWSSTSKNLIGVKKDIYELLDELAQTQES